MQSSTKVDKQAIDHLLFEYTPTYAEDNEPKHPAHLSKAYPS